MTTTTTTPVSPTAIRDGRTDARLVAFNLVYLALAWAVALGAIAVFWAVPEWWTFLLAFVVVSTRQQALLNCEHEAAHNKFLPHRKVNEVVGRYLTAAPVGSPFAAAKHRHLAHHRLVGTAEDPDLELYSGPEKTGLARHFVLGLMGVYAAMVLMGPKAATASRRGAKADLVSIVVVQLVLFAGLWLTTAWWVYPALWAAPLATLTAGCHLVRSFVEHAITEHERPGHENRLVTIRSNLLERQLLAPYNMHLHAEHHLMPSVPAPRLRDVQSRLREQAEGEPVLERRSYVAALREYARDRR